MANKILKSLKSNIGFKILAVLFAFALWLTVYNLEDPTKTKTLTVSVTVANKDNVENMGKYYEVIDGTNKVTFSVTAARSILDKLDESDFTAVADMDYITLEQDDTLGLIPIEILCTAANVNQNSIKLSYNNKNMKVALEDSMSKQFVVSANAVGTVAEGYALGDVTVTAPNVLKVSGPKSIVQNIATVVATIDVTDMSNSSPSYRATPILLDKNGKEVDTTRLTLSNTTVNVSAEILNTKEVAISIKPAGKPADGYMITSITSDPTTILLKGDKELLNSINAIEIPGNVISIEGKKENIVTTIDVSQYIPEGVTMVKGEDASVNITVAIGKIKEKSFTVNTSDIIVTGLPTHSSIEFALSSVAVKVSGLETDINSLNASNIIANIDVTDLAAGKHTLDLILDLDENKFTYQNVKIVFTIIDETPETEDQGENNTSPDETGSNNN